MRKFLEKITGGDFNVEILMEPDPLLVWSFGSIESEKTVAYEVRKFLNEECRKNLKAVAGAELILNTAHPNYNPSMLEDSTTTAQIIANNHDVIVEEGVPHDERFNPDHPESDVFVEIEEEDKGKRIIIVGDDIRERTEEDDAGVNLPPVIENINPRHLPDLIGAGVGTEQLVASDIVVNDENPATLTYDVTTDNNLLRNCRYDVALTSIFCTIDRQESDTVEITLEVTDEDDQTAFKKFEVVVNFPP